MVDAALWLIRLSHRQQRQRPRGFIQDYSTHGWPWVRVQGELLSTQMSCVQQEEEEEEKKNNSSGVPVCSWRTSPHVCIGGSPLSGRIKGRNVFELFPSSSAVSPTHLPTRPPTPKVPTRGRVYTLFIKTTVWEKNGAIISPALMGCICLVSLSAVQWWRVCVFHEHICMLRHFRSV